MNWFITGSIKIIRNNTMALTAKLPAGKTLGVFSLVMINVIAVDNLRSLTVGVEYGFALVFFYALATILFFIPTILVTAELATAWPNTGGAYIWVREAFGARMGFITIWLQWIYNVVWYPTIFTFIAGIFAALIDPQLVHNKTYMLCAVLLSYWGVTLLNCFGFKIAQALTTLGAIVGTIIPMLFIAALGFLWLYLGKPSHIAFSLSGLFPDMHHIDNLAFFTNILFGLMGMEMAAVHAGDVHNPERNYPKALGYSALIILSTLVLACLAIAIVIPLNQLNLVSGLIDAFRVFFNAYGLSFLTPVIALLIVIGSLAGASVWIAGPARGLLVASQASQLPKLLRYTNRTAAPIGILLIQGIVVTLLTSIFLIMPSVNSSYWVLSALTAQLALLYYVLIFAAAIRLRKKHPQIKRAFKIPGGMPGLTTVAGIGLITCVTTIVFGFIPPQQILSGNIIHYEIILIGGMILCSGTPFLFYKKNS
jgi:glutamate:GABA antiporter